jgi:alanine-glyoxylate transaminase/serine-glyoxylate transaminase/serine-pyruvate transaminase
MHRASEDHRSAVFPDLVRPLLADVRRLFVTEKGQVAVFTSSGSGGWDAGLTNTLAPGTTVLLPCAGQFATLWGDAARRLGYPVRQLDLAWGDAPSPAQIEATLRSDVGGSIGAVLIVHNETSTGVTADLPAIRHAIDVAGHDALLMSDGVSAIGSLPYRHDDWGVDVALTGSQKGLMLPAGLALMAFSPKALARLDAASPRAYLDLRPMLAQNAQGYFPYTPSIPMLYGLRESLAMLFDEGMPQVFTRHERLAQGVRAAVSAWGLAICCHEADRRSNTVTTVLTPAGVDAAALTKHAFSRYQLALGGGLGPLAGRAFRIGHLGDLNEGMVLGALGLVEMALRDVGGRVTPGSGPAAAESVWGAAS